MPTVHPERVKRVEGCLPYALLVLAACTDLGDVERDRCGNGVVEPASGEDCDRADADCGAPGTAAACRLLCGPPAPEGTACPDGGVCGVDGVCRAPSGQLDLTMGGAWTARYLLTGDTNGDRYPELIAVGDTLLDLRLGGPDGTFDRSVTLPNLPLFDVPRAADVNGDALTDVLVPVGIGFYSLVGDPLATLQPIFQDSFSFPTSGPMVMSSVTFTTGVGNNQVPATATVAAVHLDQGPSCPLPGGCDIVLLDDGAVAMPPGRRVEHVVGDRLAWARVLGSPPSTVVVAIAFADDPSTALDESGVFTYTGDAAAGTLTELGAIPGLPGDVRGAWFADLDRDSRADLLVAVDSPFGEAVMVAWGRSGGWETPSYVIGGPGPTLTSGRPLAWADLDGDAAADLVTDTGVWFTSCILRACAFSQGSTQDHAWRAAVISDLNGDGTADVTAVSQGSAIIDVMLGTGARGFWNQAPLVAPGEVTLVRTGDFDGNGVGDLALVTSPFDVSGADEIHVVYGRRNESPKPPAYMGFVGTVVALDVAQAPLPGSQDTIDDLFVVSERTSGRGVALVIGSTSQRMIAPLIPTAGNLEFNLVESIVAVPLDGDDTDDVISLLTTFGQDSARASMRIYTSDGAGTLTERTPVGGVPLDSQAFDLRGALWAAIPAQGATPATVVGVDVLGRAVAVTASCGGGTCTLPSPMSLLTGAEVGEPTALHTADLDGDGDLDVVATFRAVGPEPGGALVWHRDGASFGAAQVLSPPSGAAFADVAAVDLDLDGSRELMLLVRGEGDAAGVFLSTRTAAGTYGAPTRDPRFDGESAGQGITIHGGDLTGDGLADVAIVSGTDRTAPRAIAVFTHRELPGALADGDAP